MIKLCDVFVLLFNFHLCITQNVMLLSLNKGVLVLQPVIMCEIFLTIHAHDNCHNCQYFYFSGSFINSKEQQYQSSP